MHCPLQEPGLGQEPQGSKAESSQSPLGCRLGLATTARRFCPMELGPQCQALSRGLPALQKLPGPRPFFITRGHCPQEG